MKFKVRDEVQLKSNTKIKGTILDICFFRSEVDLFNDKGYFYVIDFPNASFRNRWFTEDQIEESDLKVFKLYAVKIGGTFSTMKRVNAYSIVEAEEKALDFIENDLDDLDYTLESYNILESAVDEEW